MGFLSRWKHLSKPRSMGSGKLWDNTNTPGSVGPSVTTMSPMSSMHTTENYYTRGPNPEPYLHSGASVDTYRLHSAPDMLTPRIPVTVPRNAQSNINIQNDVPRSPAQAQNLPKQTLVLGSAPARTRIRDVVFDAGNPTFLRTPQAWTASQRYWKETEDIVTVPQPAKYAHAVQASIYPVQTGWDQSFVPEPGMRLNEFGKAPPYLLSKPLRVVTVVPSTGHRSPIKNAVAPKRKRS